MIQKIEITITWWDNEINNVKLPEQYKEKLEVEAVNQIKKKWADDYTGGELNIEIEGVYYNGIWSLEIKTIE